MLGAWTGRCRREAPLPVFSVEAAVQIRGGIEIDAAFLWQLVRTRETASSAVSPFAITNSGGLSRVLPGASAGSVISGDARRNHKEQCNEEIENAHDKHPNPKKDWNIFWQHCEAQKGGNNGQGRNYKNHPTRPSSTAPQEIGQETSKQKTHSSLDNLRERRV